MARRRDSEGGGAANGRAPAADLDTLEREYVEQLARAHAALAEAQDRSYWLDRWELDLNALMSRPGMRRLRGLLRWTRELKRGAEAARAYASKRLGDLRRTAVEDEIAAAAAAAPATAVEDDPAAVERP